MKLIRQLLAVPFLYPGLLLIFIAMLITKGAQKTTLILKGFNIVLTELNKSEKESNG